MYTEPKKDYVVHFRVLQFAVKHGFILDDVSAIYIGDQRPWLRDYVKHNNNFRSEADSRNDEFCSSRMKDMNNFLFGKTAEQVRNRTNVVIKIDDHEARKLISKPTFKRSQVLNEDLLIIESTVKNLKLNKPIYIAATTYVRISL